MVVAISAISVVGRVPAATTKVCGTKSSLSAHIVALRLHNGPVTQLAVIRSINPLRLQ